MLIKVKLFRVLMRFQKVLLFLCIALMTIISISMVRNLFLTVNGNELLSDQPLRKTAEIGHHIVEKKTTKNEMNQEKGIPQTRHFSHQVSSKQYEVKDLLPSKLLTTFEPIDDRIQLQLQHVPKSYQKALDKNETIPMKLIYFHGNERNWYMKDDQSYFLIEECPVNRCLVTYNKVKGRNADAVVFSNPSHMPFLPEWPRKSSAQIWAVYALETPFNTRSMNRYKDYLNWTMTYRRDSTITTPYFKFIYKHQTLPNKTINLAEKKSKKVAWMVSNCRRVNSGRMKYARELAKHIDVDIYGACGTKKCRKNEGEKCHEMIKRDYKFYLVFENSKCLGYMTEKLPQNAFSNDAIPIVLGVSRAEMKELAPPRSYIHVEDFSSPSKLADYLHKIDQDDNLFNSYFEWRHHGEMINTKTWCRFCAMLHEKDLPAVTQYNIDNWWKQRGVCIGDKPWGY